MAAGNGYSRVRVQEEILKRFRPLQIVAAQERLCGKCLFTNTSTTPAPTFTIGEVDYKCSHYLLPITRAGQDCPYFTPFVGAYHQQ